MLSAVHTKGALRKGCEAILVVVTHVADEDINPQIEETASEGLKAFIKQYDDVFASESPQGVPQDRNAFETIPLAPNSEPPFKHMYRLNPQEREEVTKQITEILKKELIEPSTAPYGAPNCL